MRKTGMTRLVLLGLVVILGCGSSTDTGANDSSSKSASSSKNASSSKTNSSTSSKTKTTPSTTDTSTPSDDKPASDDTTTPTTPNDTMAKSGDPRGKCDIDSSFPDDNACLLPPDPSEGIQIHVGPTDYKDPDQINKFIFKAGMEASQCWTFHTPNDEQFYYQTFVLSGRAGTHHIINSMYKIEIADGGFTTCLDGGTGTNSNIIDNLPGASKAYMARGTVAPEYADVGRSVPANTASQADMHYFNYTDKDLLREFWMNIYFVPKDQIKREGAQIRGMGGVSWGRTPIAPGTDMTYSYSCPIDTDGKIMSLLGHFHSHGKRFSASIKRTNGDIEKVFEMYDYLDPANFEYNSVVKNPEFSDTAAGATSGVLDVHAGEQLLWDCHVVNDSMTALRYINNVATGEMCNLWGESLGPKVNCVLQ